MILHIYMNLIKIKFIYLINRLYYILYLIYNITKLQLLTQIDNVILLPFRLSFLFRKEALNLDVLLLLCIFNYKKFYKISHIHGYINYY